MREEYPGSLASDSIKISTRPRRRGWAGLAGKEQQASNKVPIQDLSSSSSCFNSIQPVPSYNPISSLVYASCSESRSTQGACQEQEDGQRTAAAAPALLLVLPPICGRPAGPSLFLFFLLPRLFPSRIHLHLQYASTAQHQQRNNQTLKNILSETPCFVSDTDLLRMLNIIDRSLKYQTVLVRRPGLAAASEMESFIYFCGFMNLLWGCR